MRLEAEGLSPIEEPSEAQVISILKSLRAYGPTSFASLTDDKGNYLQVGGGGVACMLEHRDIVKGRHYRGYRDKPGPTPADDTTLTVGGSRISLKIDECFNVSSVVDAFVAFRARQNLPPKIKWRDVSEMFPDLSRTR